MNKTPAVRFKGFSEDWEQRKLKEFGYSEGGTSIESEFSEKGKYKVISIGSYSEDSKYTDQGIRAIESDKTIRRILEQNDLTMILNDKTASGNIIGRVLFIDESNVFVYNQRTEMLRPNQVFYYPKFLYHLLNAPKHREKIIKQSQGNTQIYVNWSKISDITYMLPELGEQTNISKFYDQLDNLITNQQHKYEKLVNIKKSLLYKMFPQNGSKVPEIRFKGFTEDWKQQGLGELVQFSKGTGYSKSDLKETGTPIILYGRLYTKYETVIENVDTFADEKSGSVYSCGGEVIVPASGETAEDIAIASVVKSSGVLLGGDLNVIYPPKFIDSAFLAISISNGKPHSDMTKMAQGKTVVHLHNTDLEKIILLYPNYEEQLAISNYFNTLDELITLTKNKLEKLKQIKQAMLHKMFV